MVAAKDAVRESVFRDDYSDTPQAFLGSRFFSDPPREPGPRPSSLGRAGFNLARSLHKNPKQLPRGKA
jgi:hypothetical protein